MAFARAIMLLVSLLLPSAAARAEFPKGDELAKAYTGHDLARDMLAYNRHTLVDAYKAAGHSNPKWDAPTLKLLEGASRYFTSAAVPLMYRLDDTPTKAAMLALSQPAIDAGSDDALVLYCHAVALNDNNRATDAKPFLIRAHETMVKGKYPPVRTLVSATRQRPYIPEEKSNELDNLIGSKMWRTVEGPFINGAHRRAALQRVQEAMSYYQPKVRDRLNTLLGEHKTCDPWINHVIQGSRQIELAWEARGRGWANQVPEAAWKTFFAHLKTAEEHLTKAWQLHPNLPEAPTLMIKVAMGASNGTEKQWFDRAVRAQIDHEQGYDFIYEALMPRWGGSHEQILEIGIEAARTNRYDTLVPYQLIDAIEKVTADEQRPGGKWDVWSQPEAYRLAGDVFTNYAKQLKAEQGANWYRSYHAAIAWRIGKLDEARKILDELGDKAQPELFHKVGASGEATISQTYALTGAHAKDVQAATGLLDKASPEEAHKAFSALAAKLDRGDKGHFYVRDRLRCLDYRIRFDSGEWIDALPAEDLTGWRSDLGTWTLDKPAAGGKAALLGTSSNIGASIVLDVPLPANRYEVEATLEFPGLDLNATRLPIAGLRCGSGDLRTHTHTIVVLSGPPEGALTVVGTPAQVPTLIPRADAFRLRFACFDGSISAAVNDTSFAPRRGGDPKLNASPYLGLFIHHSCGIGQRIRVTQLRFRKLDQEPSAAKP